MKKIIFFAAIISGSLSLGVHVSTHLGVNVEEAFPAVMGLHAGIFLLFIPMIVMLRKNPEIQRYEQQPWHEKMRNPFGLWTVALAHCPLPLKILTGVCLLYAIINFMTGMSDRNLSILNYFSGMWMAFYSFILSISYPFRPQQVL